MAANETTFRRYLFDAYGTLLDLSDALGPAQAKLGDKAAFVLAHWRKLQLEYAWLSALGETYRDFSDATQAAFRDALAHAGVDDPTLAHSLSNAFREAPAYADAPEALDVLKAGGAKMAILSNGAPAMLNAAVAASGLDARLDAVLSVDEAQTYKPAPAAYRIGREFMQAPACKIMFVSSNWWDVIGARNFGYEAVLIDRSNTQEHVFWPASQERPKQVYTSLIEFARAQRR